MFEVAVIGAGSSGCALAASLAAAGKDVALIEAGPDYGARRARRWPRELLDPRVRPDSHDWGWDEPRAKVIGGCSAHNQCAAIWPPFTDFDGWGIRGWRGRDLAHLVDAVERSRHVSPYRGRHGRLSTGRYRDDELATWQRSFLRSAIAAGLPRVRDLSAPAPAQCVAPFYANVKDGVRWNAAFAFLDPIYRRTRLRFFADTLADRLVLDGRRATSVRVRAGGREREIFAREFVVCAGAFGSPALLLRSGIGPSGQLRALGIRVQLDLPGVGANLHDHPGAAVSFRPTRALRRAARAEAAEGRSYQSQVIARADSTGRGVDFDLHLVPYQGFRDGDEPTFEVLVFAMAPRSRGSVRLRSADPEDPPRIELRTFSDRGDLDAVVRGIELVRRIVEEEPLRSAICAVRPGRRVTRRDALRAYVRGAAASYQHPVGTCRMGARGDRGAVVDGRGRVHGLANVRVADASIVPAIPRANTNLTCMLVGLRVAESMLGSRSRT